jgi:hypothetical protein
LWNYDYLNEKLVHKKLRIGHIRLQGAGGKIPFTPEHYDAILLTGTTADLQKKLREIENDPNIFWTAETIEYRRQQ